MLFFELPAILVAVYCWNFRILQTINAYQKSTQQGKLVSKAHPVSLKLDEKFSRCISYSGQIVFFQFLHYTCFSSAICPLQVPDLPLSLHNSISKKREVCNTSFCFLPRALYFLCIHFTYLR